MHKFKIIFGILIYLSIGGFAFAQNQFSNFTILENAVDIHAGVHAALNPADDSLEFTAYSAATNHGLVHVTIDDGNAVVTEIEANVFAGLVPATGLDTYFVFGSDGKRYVAYYHQVAGVFKVATDASGSWVTHVIDNTGTTGLSPILSVSSPGNIFSAYYRSDSGDLVSSSGTLGGIYTRTVLANVGNVDPEVSFVGNPQVGSRELLFRNENLTTVRHAIFSSNTWTQSSLGIDGYNPSGSYNDNGDFYVNAAAENYSGLGASDTGFLYYYKASDGAPNSGINFDKGHAPDFSQTSYASAYAMRAGLATLDVLENENLGEQSRAKGEFLRQALRNSLERFEFVKEIRGLGLMNGIVFKPPTSMSLKVLFSAFRHAHAGLFGQMIVRALFGEHQILSQMAGNDHMVIKVMPPLVVTESSK